MALVILTDGTRLGSDRVIVKTSGWVKVQQDGSFSHYPPDKVERIAEPNPDERTDFEGEPTGEFKSDVVYQSPHGSV